MVSPLFRFVGKCVAAAAFVVYCAGCLSIAVAEKASDATPGDIVLERVPPKSPDEALASFEVADGFRIELAAAEPLVVDPVAMAFDEAGQLYVVEMRDYSEQDKERLGRVRLLSDADGDGRFETSRVFVEGLSWPTAVACYDGGVFIGNAPDILYCKDTDGDGGADEQHVVFTGFGRSNVQGLLNSFQWGLDNRIHGATSSAAGQISRPGTAAEPLDLRGRDFSFDPKTLAIAAETGGGQHGLTFNRWGDKFVCHNSDHLQAIVFEERYLGRNPFQSVPSARRSIAADGPQAAVYRISPVEAWRAARTKMRVAGLAPGPIEGGGQPAGYFTSATGVTVYEGGLWGDENEVWVYVADVGSNLIHRKRLISDGVTYLGERVDKQNEFVRSGDIWFRPVQMAIGPDGALYVADMYREVIEHPASLPPELKRQIDLTSGNDRGRIYRVVPEDFRYTAPASLASASTAELVAQLDDANMWRRTTASRLLYEAQDPKAVDLLRKKLMTAKRPEARIAVLHALAGCRALAEPELLAALRDSHPQVRRHALRLAEPRVNSSANVRNAAISLAKDEDPIVQFQLALSLGVCDEPVATEALASVMRNRVANRDIVDAALTSIGTNAGALLKSLMADSAWMTKPSARPMVEAIVAQIVRQRSEPDLAALLEIMKTSNKHASSAGMGVLARALGRLSEEAFASGGLSQLTELQRLQRLALPQLISEARRIAQDGGAPIPLRAAAVEDLALGSFLKQRDVLEELMSPQEAPAIHAAVLAASAQFDDPQVAELVLSTWNQLAPQQRSQAAELLLRREPWSLQLIEYLQESNVPLATLDPGHVARLENYPSAEVRKRAQALRGNSISEDRRQIFADYRDAALANGDEAKGKLVFEKNCAACHNLDARSQAIGPNLAAMVNRGAESLLFNVLVPNGEVDPRYLEYVVLTVDGEVISGVLASESATAVTIRGADHKSTAVLRVDIEELRNTGKSLMPEGFEKTIDKQSMADLLAYLQQAAKVGKE